MAEGGAGQCASLSGFVIPPVTPEALYIQSTSTPGAVDLLAGWPTELAAGQGAPSFLQGGLRYCIDHSIMVMEPRDIFRVNPRLLVPPLIHGLGTHVRRYASNQTYLC